MSECNDVGSHHHLQLLAEGSVGLFGRRLPRRLPPFPLGEGECVLEHGRRANGVERGRAGEPQVGLLEGIARAVCHRRKREAVDFRRVPGSGGAQSHPDLLERHGRRRGRVSEVPEAAVALGSPQGLVCGERRLADAGRRGALEAEGGALGRHGLVGDRRLLRLHFLEAGLELAQARPEGRVVRLCHQLALHLCNRLLELLELLQPCLLRQQGSQAPAANVTRARLIPLRLLLLRTTLLGAQQAMSAPYIIIIVLTSLLLLLCLLSFLLHIVLCTATFAGLGSSCGCA